MTIFILLLFTHMKMKKMLLGAFLGIFAVAGIAFLPGYTNAQSWGNVGDTQGGEWWGGGYEQFGASEKLWYDQQDLKYAPSVYGKDAFQKDNMIVTIKKAINWVLGILSFVALCLCLWGGFQMMTSGGDSKKYESWLNLLKWAAIGLAVIAVSWLVVSLIFYVINTAQETWDWTAAQ